MLFTNSYAKHHVGMVRFLAYTLDINPKFCWAFVHRKPPFTNIEITSWIIDLKDCPCNTFQAVWDSWIEFTHFDYQVHRWFKILEELWKGEIYARFGMIFKVWIQCWHFDEAWLWISEDLTIPLHTETKFTVFYISRGRECLIEEYVHSIWVLFFLDFRKLIDLIISKVNWVKDWSWLWRFFISSMFRDWSVNEFKVFA